jgi:pimeloyl-ACP methyl ester carboxylesterase
MILLAMADAIQKILGPDQPIIGFDPRGVSFTTPRADCWAKPPACTGCPEDAASGLMHRLEWDQMNSVYGLLNSSNVALKFLEAGHRAVNDLCRSKNAQLGAESILGHASTAHVARDMVSIVDAWDRWIESRGLPPSSLKGKLVYWGFSYGTYLGATFAKMFPDRVGRMILDGVVDADYYVSPVWEESLLDTDKVLDRFFLYCARAGRRCSLYREGDKAEDVGRRYSEIMERLQTSPVTFTHPEHFYPVILRASYVKTIVFSVLYSPIQGFPILAMLLNWIHEGRFDELAGLFQDATLMCSIIGNPAITGMLSDAQRAIMCSDKTQRVRYLLVTR